MNRYVLILLTCLSGLVGCNHSTGSRGPVAGLAGGGSEGDVVVLFADGPAEPYDRIFITLHEVSLCPADGGSPVVLFRSEAGEQIDILDARVEELVLTMVSGVPAGTYSKVVVEISDVYTEGGPCDDLTVLISAGRVDVTSSRPIVVTGDELLSLRLQIDASMSLDFVSNATPQMCTFTPVVIVDPVPGSPADRGLRSLVGTIVSVVDEGEDPVGLILDLGSDRGLLNVTLPPGFGNFDEDGLPVDPSNLAPGQVVTVRGDLDDEGRLVAVAVIQGQALELDGIVADVVDETEFELEPEAGSAVVGNLDVLVTMETVLLAEGVPTDATAILPQRRATVVGKLSLDSTELRASVVDLGAAPVRGLLVAVAPAAGGTDLTIRPEGTDSDVILLLPTGREIRVDGGGPVDLALLEEVLRTGPRQVLVTRDLDNPGQVLEATLGADEVDGIVTSRNLGARELTVNGQVVRVRPDAMILDLVTGQQAIPFEDIAVGDRVRVFALPLPSDTTLPTYAGVDFEGFVVLVEPTVPTMDQEGCCPGFWRYRPSAWPAPYRTGWWFSEVFADAFPGKTLHQVLRRRGGGLNGLGRHTVAALLNAASPQIDFPLTPTEVIELFNDAVATNSNSGSNDDDDDDDDDGWQSGGLDYTAIAELKSFFEGLNASSCPL